MTFKVFHYIQSVLSDNEFQILHYLKLVQAIEEEKRGLNLTILKNLVPKKFLFY